MKRSRLRRVSPTNSSRRHRGAYYTSPEWEQIRHAALERDDYRCRLRLMGCTRTASTAHHVYYPTEIRTTELVHLVAACAWCNAQERELRLSPCREDVMALNSDLYRENQEGNQ